MEKLNLLVPTPAYAGQIAAYRQEYLAHGGSMDGSGSLKRTEDPLVWIAECEKFTRQETVPQGRVPATQFLGVRREDDALVGMLQVRHYLNDYLAQFGGHIGYCVRPSERRKGYAGEMLRQALVWCREELALERVLITCLSDNEASRRTILSAGGVYDGTVHEPDANIDLERYWITL